jgi:peptide deformylase
MLKSFFRLTGIMIYKVVKYPEKVLERPSEPVTVFDGDLAKLVEDMFETMYAAHGVGLAAPQIGISKRLVVIDVSFGEDPQGKLVLCNPEVIHTAGKASMEEGCLSLPGFRAPLARPKTATVRAQDLNGEWFEKTGEELLARAFCHETDHLNGRLFITHLSVLRRDLIKRRIKKMIKAGEWP